MGLCKFARYSLTRTLSCDTVLLTSEVRVAAGTSRPLERSPLGVGSVDRASRGRHLSPVGKKLFDAFIISRVPYVLISQQVCNVSRIISVKHGIYAVVWFYSAIYVYPNGDYDGIAVFGKKRKRNKGCLWQSLTDVSIKSYTFLYNHK